MTGAVAAMLGERLHLQHGPIDLIVSAEGDASQVRQAYAQARIAFDGLLQTLVDDLRQLRRDARSRPSVSGPVARRMVEASSCHDAFVTPMAAVAGSVADHILAALRAGCSLRRAFVNNGGDIALWLADGESARFAVCADPRTARDAARVEISSADLIAGVATSGWRGRSHSLGIADAVTVLARSAADADVAATLIANAVDLPTSPCITRAPADSLAPDSDLGPRLVTTAVASLARHDIAVALDRGVETARHFERAGRIASAFLTLQGEARTVGHFQAITGDQA